ncbi:pyridoxal phosphate-dependent aminotransferase [Mycobacterium simiae]|uniref:cysteine-S-conjugate beta-lyase n=1 Tax=Mycobacterium simiae TaxID=1784 RepID=A0A5B1BQS4_MYCSI|nr:MalY/PatB family protein [Mycobacterium simiae]KAA1250145.1 pyridoxal phosphate-dependent aminotransferase [Mycobacterium simiae]
MNHCAFDRLTEDQLRRRKTLKWNHFDPAVLPLWVAEMDYPTAPAVRSAVQACLANEEFGYPPFGEDSLSRATAAWCQRRYGWPIRPDWVRPIPDVLRGMLVAINYLTRPKSPVVLPIPAYPPFFDLRQVTDRPRIEIPMLRQASGRYLLDLESMDAAFVRGAGSLILCNPNNPLGTVYTEDELRAIVEIAARYGARIIADEIWGPLVYDGSHVPAASVSELAAETVITLTSAAKGWNLPGLMCAQVILSNYRDVQRWQRVNILDKVGVSTVGIRANIAAYDHGAPWLDDLLSYLRANRNHLTRVLPELVPGLGVIAPQGTYLSWIDFRELDLAVEPADYLFSKAKVALSPGITFGAAGAGFARLNFATTRVILDRAIKAIATTLCPVGGRVR